VKKSKIVDPYQAREAQKYEKPIPSREFILNHLVESGRLMRREELIEALGLDTPEEQEGLRRRLRAMERDGQLIFTRRGGYGVAEKMDLVRGRVIGHKDGFGFVVPDDGGEDLFLSPGQMRVVFHGDRVLVRVAGVDRKGRREGSIVEVLEHNTHTIVGRLFTESGITFVTPDSKRINQDIFIPPGQEDGAKPGQIVIVEITTQPTARMQPIGKIIEVLGEHMAPGMEIEIAIRNYNLPHVWPEAVQEEIIDLHPSVLEHDKQNRVDLRHLSLVTIDGEDAKDFDDAVYCEKYGRHWKLYVAIADVSHYVEPNTALDQEALQRGTSVYFPGEVIPMLPEILSNGLCSLKPKVDRLCMVCEMVISSSGKLKSFEFYPAVMHSQARLTYTEVAGMLENAKHPSAKSYGHLLPHLKNLLSLYKVLHARREARGAIDFETTETKVIFGEQRKIKQIVPAERNVAHRIIEECMLMANVAAASFVLKKKLPALFRIHEGPNPDKLQDLRDFLGELGLRLPGRKEPKPADYAALLQQIKDRPDAHLIQTVLLRSLSQAVYSPDNIGHFGLAFDAYAHFTSPIRRYPDLLIHRAIRHGLTAKRKTFMYDHAAMVSFGEHCSMAERRADEATRDALDWLKCEFIKDRVGEEFDGIVSSVTGFGLFVELKDIYVEGLVHVTALKNDYYHFDPLRRQLRGERAGNIYHLGDRVRVRVAKVNLEDRQIDFDMVNGNVKAGNKSGGKKGKFKSRR
jgi:ribonuclease R